MSAVDNNMMLTTNALLHMWLKHTCDDSELKNDALTRCFVLHPEMRGRALCPGRNRWHHGGVKICRGETKALRAEQMINNSSEG